MTSFLAPKIYFNNERSEAHEVKFAKPAKVLILPEESDRVPSQLVLGEADIREESEIHCCAIAKDWAMTVERKRFAVCDTTLHE